MHHVNPGRRTAIPSVFFNTTSIKNMDIRLVTVERPHLIYVMALINIFFMYIPICPCTYVDVWSPHPNPPPPPLKLEGDWDRGLGVVRESMLWGTWVGGARVPRHASRVVA